MINNKSLTIDLNRIQPNKTIKMHEGDTNSVFIVLTVTENDGAVDLTGLTIEYDATIANYLAEQGASGSISNNKIVIPVTSNMTAMSGILSVDVRMIDGTEILYTQTIKAIVEKSVVNGSTAIDISGTTIGAKLAELEANSRKVTILDYATSSAMNFEVPSIYEGEIGDIVVLTIDEFNNRVGGTIWQLRSTQVVSGVTHYLWQQVADAADLEDKEDVANKTNAITDSNKSSTTLYPSVKAVVDFLPVVVLEGYGEVGAVGVYVEILYQDIGFTRQMHFDELYAILSSGKTAYIVCNNFNGVADNFLYVQITSFSKKMDGGVANYSISAKATRWMYDSSPTGEYFDVVLTANGGATSGVGLHEYSTQ